MKKLAILFVAPVLVYAVSLQELLDTAVKNNNIVASYKLTEKSKQKDLDASKNSYYPTIDIGGNYQSLQEKSPNRPGDVYSGFINIGVDLYDGGYKSSRVDSSKAALLSSKLQTSAYIKSLEYAIVEDFYDIKNVESKIKALKEKSVQLKAELQRVKQFFEVGSATKDEIDRLQAALSNNIYSIESSKYQLSSLKQSLGIKVGKEIKNLDDAMITTPTFKGEELSDEIKAMIANTEVYTYNAKSIDSNYNPKFRLENAYTVYEYDRDDAAHPNSIDNQNKLTLSFSMKLYDNGSMKNQKESVLLQKRALEESNSTIKTDPKGKCSISNSKNRYSKSTNNKCK